MCLRSLLWHFKLFVSFIKTTGVLVNLFWSSAGTVLAYEQCQYNRSYIESECKASFTSCHAQGGVQWRHHLFLQLTVDPPTQQRPNVCQEGQREQSVSHQQCIYKTALWVICTLDKYCVETVWVLNLLSRSDRTLFLAVVYWAVRYSICCNRKTDNNEYILYIFFFIRFATLPKHNALPQGQKRGKETSLNSRK